MGARPDGSRRTVDRFDESDAKRDLEQLLALRAEEVEPAARRTKLLSFNDVLDAWFEAGGPNVAPTTRSRHARVKSGPSTGSPIVRSIARATRKLVHR